VFDIESVIRRRNIATLVTKDVHSFKNNDIVKVASTLLDYNYYSGIEIVLDTLKLNSVVSIENNNPYYHVKFAIPTQRLAPLAPRFTSIKGVSAVTTADTFDIVEPKSTSGAGTGAKFKLVKGNNGTFNYNGLTTITLLEPGDGYLPKDTITISGADLNGADGINDLTFTLLNGTEFLYKINGNSNSKYNGEFSSVDSTASTITLAFNENPGTFGSGLISIATGLTTYDHVKKVVYQYTYPELVYVQSFPSDAEAEIATGISKQNISKVTLGLRNHAGKFFWSRTII
jgi:hypothetical protein